MYIYFMCAYCFLNNYEGGGGGGGGGGGTIFFISGQGGKGYGLFFWLRLFVKGVIFNVLIETCTRTCAYTYTYIYTGRVLTEGALAEGRMKADAPEAKRARMAAVNFMVVVVCVGLCV
jgi:hypothetical protein